MITGTAMKRFVFPGFIADLLQIIHDETGIEFNVFTVEDGKYGQRDQQGNWNGMIGELTRRVRNTTEVFPN